MATWLFPSFLPSYALLPTPTIPSHHIYISVPTSVLSSSISGNLRYVQPHDSKTTAPSKTEILDLHKRWYRRRTPRNKIVRTSKKYIFILESYQYPGTSREKRSTVAPSHPLTTACQVRISAGYCLSTLGQVERVHFISLPKHDKTFILTADCLRTPFLPSQVTTDCQTSHKSRCHGEIHTLQFTCFGRVV